MTRRKKFTALAISKWSKPKRRIEHPDPEKRGLYLIQHETGRLTWAMRFRDPSGAIRKLTLGPYSSDDTGEEPVEGAPLTIAGARQLAAKIDAKRQRGLDPITEREKRKHEAARANINDNRIPAAFDLYIKHGRRTKVAQGIKRDRGWQNTAQVLGLKYNGEDKPILISGGLAERWQTKRADEITVDDVFIAMQDTRLNGVPGRPVRNTQPSEARAREMLAALGGCFRWLTGQRRVLVNPCSGLQRPQPPRQRKRVLNFQADRRRGDELRWFWAAGNYPRPIVAFSARCY